MMSGPMADLEKLAVQRDRGYLVRLVLGLAVAVVVSIFLFRGLTGEQTSGCIADAFLGGDAKQPGTPP
jgi:hypothetical protein